MSDLINRQAAIEAFRKSLCALETESGREYGISFSGVEQTLKSLPSAQPERMRGKWIDDGDPFMWVCDVCGYRVKRYNNTRYCPNCGAEMRGDADE